MRCTLNMVIIVAVSLLTQAAESAPFGTYVDRPIVGWHWYNEPLPKEDAPEDDTLPLSALPPAIQITLLRKLTQDRLSRAILMPTVQHAADYLRLQSRLISLSGQFTQTVKKALLLYPDLDYNLVYSHYNAMAPLQLASAQRRQTNAIYQLAQRYGLFFFYRGLNPLDNQMALIVSQFARHYGLSLVPVSMDGARSDALPQTRRDEGQAAHMGIKQYPALFLIAPDTGHYQPLAYGFITQDDLSRRFLDVATDFQAQY